MHRVIQWQIYLCLNKCKREILVHSNWKLEDMLWASQPDIGTTFSPNLLWKSLFFTNRILSDQGEPPLLSLEAAKRRRTYWKRWERRLEACRLWELSPLWRVFDKLPRLGMTHDAADFRCRRLAGLGGLHDAQSGQKSWHSQQQTQGPWGRAPKALH